MLAKEIIKVLITLNLNCLKIADDNDLASAELKLAFNTVSEEIYVTRICNKDPTLQFDEVRNFFKQLNHPSNFLFTILTIKSKIIGSKLSEFTLQV